MLSLLFWFFGLLSMVMVAIGGLVLVFYGFQDEEDWIYMLVWAIIAGLFIWSVF